MDEFDDFLGEEPKETGILVTDKYKIDTLDVLNVVVKQKYIPKEVIKDGEGNITNTLDKEPQWKVISYHPSLEYAFKSIVDTEVNLTVKNGIEKVIKKIEELKSFKKVIQ